MPDSADAKLDEILCYIKSARRWAMFRAVISMILFLVFVVLPIIGSLYLADWLKDNVNWNHLQRQFDTFQEMRLPPSANP